MGTGEKLVGKYATVKVALKESIVADGKFYSYDYGVKEYDSSMLRVAGYVVASEGDHRINTKNAVIPQMWNDSVSIYSFTPWTFPQCRR